MVAGIWALQLNPGEKANGTKLYTHIFVPVCVYQMICFVVLDHIFVFLVTHVNLQEGQLTAINDNNELLLAYE